MAYHIEINSSVVDEYVREATVPVVSRKRDYTPVFESAKIVIDGEYGTPTKNYKVVLFQDTAVLWAGFIEDFVYNYKTGAWTLDVRSYLLQLEKTLVTYTNLHSFFIADPFAGERYIASDQELRPNMNLRQLFLKIFDSFGFALGVANVHDQVLFQHDYSSVEYDYDLDTLCIDENMLYALNQSVAADYNLYEGNDDYKQNMLTCADVIKYFMSICGFSIRCINDSPITYDLFPCGRNSFGIIDPSNDDFYDLDNDLKFGYKDKVILGKQTGWIYEGQWAERYRYQNTNLDVLNQGTKASSNDGQKRLQVYSNLRILLRDQRVAADAGDVLPTTGNNHWFIGQMVHTKVQAHQTNHRREEITTLIPDYTDLKETVTKEVFTLSKRTSRIIQETNLGTSG